MTNRDCRRRTSSISSEKRRNKITIDCKFLWWPDKNSYSLAVTISFYSANIASAQFYYGVNRIILMKNSSISWKTVNVPVSCTLPRKICGRIKLWLALLNKYAFPTNWVTNFIERWWVICMWRCEMAINKEII